MSLAPVCLFVYNRLEETKQTVAALKANTLAKKTDLFVFSDGPKSENEERLTSNVRAFIKLIDGFKSVSINESNTNQGLANSVIKGVSSVLSKNKNIIVLEDDLITTPNFLDFMNQALDFYQNNKKVISISGFTLPITFKDEYSFDAYASYRASSWGWATWNDKWINIDWDVSDYDQFLNDKKFRRRFNRGGNDLCRMLKRQVNKEIDSWAIRFCYHQCKKNQLTVFPTSSKVVNVGFTPFATHTKKNIFNIKKDVELKSTFCFPEPAIDKYINKQFRYYFSYFFKFKSRLKNLF